MENILIAVILKGDFSLESVDVSRILLFEFEIKSEMQQRWYCVQIRFLFCLKTLKVLSYLSLTSVRITDLIFHA